MEYIRCQQRILPIRFAFAVSISDKESVLNAVRYSTALWGGFGNVILPIWKKFPNKEIKNRSLGLLRDFDPDFIVNLTSLPLPKKIISDYQDRIIPKNEFIKKNKDGSFRFSSGLTILPLLNYVWTTETKSISKKSRALYFKDIKKSKYCKYWSFIFGDFPDSFSIEFRYLFSSRLKARELKASFKNLKKIEPNEVFPPILFTTYQLSRVSRGGGFSSHLIYVGNLTNICDLIEFWNIRASGCEVLFIPITYFKIFEKQILSLINAGDYPINERVQNYAEIQKGPSAKKVEFERICNWIKDQLKHNLPRRSWLPDWGTRPQGVSKDIVPCRYVDIETTTNLMFDGEKLAPLELTRPSFFKDDKLYLDFRRYYREKIYWANEINLGDNYENDYFFNLPCDRTLNKLLFRSFILGSLDKIRLTEEGVIYFDDSVMDTINISPLKTEEVINEMFSGRGMKISPSAAGVFTKRIIEYMGGLDECRVFKIRGVRKILVELSKQKPRFGMTYGDLKGVVGYRKTDQFGGPNWDNSIYKDLVLYYKQPKPLTPEIAIDYLFKKNVFRVGLRFICQKCGKEDWYHLTEFNINFTCRYCFKSQHIGSLEGTSKKEWHYKADGLFMIPNAGEGSLSVILALWRLCDLAHGNGFKYITSQDIKGVKNGEVDFVTVFTNHFQMGSVLVLGEARSFVNFTREDVSKLIKIGSKFMPKPYLCFATLKDKFSDKEKQELKRVKRHGFGLIALTRLELDPYYLFDRFDEAPNKHAVTIKDFSENTVKLNIED